MSVLLFVVGAITLVVGVGAIGFGIPINEFSFGNTLIVAGMTAAVGGLIVFALGAVIAQLHRLTETLADAAARSTGTVGTFEPPVAGHARAARIPFPSPQPPDAPVAAPPPFAPVVPPVGQAPVGPGPGEEPPGQSSATLPPPNLRNPQAPHAGTADLPPLSSPPRSAPPPPAANSDMSAPAAVSPEPPSHEPQPVEPRTRATSFDSMWPPARRRTEPVVASAHAEPATGSGHDASEAPAATGSAAQSPEPAARAEEQPRAVAVLKSGVVDGMGYTLYVDGSIEAELPQGTLRFASINELRAHLEKSA